MSSFLKYHSLGNDFILIAGDVLLEPELAQALCDRQRGIGADGILIYSESTSESDPIHALVQNADGSDGNFSGNGLRCLAQHFFAQCSRDKLTIMMAQRLMQCTKNNSEITTTIPRGSCEEPIEIVHDNKTLVGYRVDVGNPHLIIFENVHRSWLEQHGLFFARYGGIYANVTFATRHPLSFSHHSPKDDGKKLQRDHALALRAAADNNGIFALTFERGVGFTQSCSSAAAALTTLCAHLDQTPSASYVVQMPGGSVSTSINEHYITLSAQAYQVFEGHFFTPALIESCKSAYRN